MSNASIDYTFFFIGLVVFIVTVIVMINKGKKAPAQKPQPKPEAAAKPEAAVTPAASVQKNVDIEIDPPKAAGNAATDDRPQPAAAPATADNPTPFNGGRPEDRATQAYAQKPEDRKTVGYGGDYIPPKPAPAPKPVQKRVLVGEAGAFAGKTIPLSGFVTIGRNPQATIALPENTPGVSYNHCSIQFANGTVTVTDNNSSYGTWIDNHRLAPQQGVVMHRGQKLYLGSKQQVFTLQG